MDNNYLVHIKDVLDAIGDDIHPLDYNMQGVLSRVKKIKPAQSAKDIIEEGRKKRERMEEYSKYMQTHDAFEDVYLSEELSNFSLQITHSIRENRDNFIFETLSSWVGYRLQTEISKEQLIEACEKYYNNIQGTKDKKMRFLLNGCDINFIAEAPEDMTVKQLVEQADRIVPDWCACGVCSYPYTTLDTQIFFDYDDVRKANDDVACKILQKGEEQ